jgi:urea transport system substrate-binding protein
VAPNQQVFPTIDWLLSDAGGNRSKLFLVGSDYVYPWTVHLLVKGYCSEVLGGKAQILGFDYLPLEHQDFRQTVQQIKDLKPDAIINTINGLGNISFFEELLRQQVAASETPVVSMSVSENQANVMAVEPIQGQYAAWSYFQTLTTGRNKDFVQRFQAEHGEDRPIDDPMATAYAQIYLWKAAVELAGSFDPKDVRAALQSGLAIDAPLGPLQIDPRSHYSSKRFRLGRVRSDRRFDIVYESPEPVAPDPFPQFAFPGWSVDWSKGRLVKGEPVTITSPGSSIAQKS